MSIPPGEVKPPEDRREYLHSFTAAVFIPGLQALFTGAFLGLASGVCAAIFGAGRGSWSWGAGVFIACSSVVWLALMWRWLRLTKPLETLIGVDLDRDGRIGSKPTFVKVQLTTADRHTTQFADIPTTRAKLADFGRGVLNGDPISERRWSGAGALFSQNEFRSVRDVMLARNWLRWVNPDYPKLGCEITAPGRAVMRSLVDLPTGSDDQTDFSDR